MHLAVFRRFTNQFGSALNAGLYVSGFPLSWCWANVRGCKLCFGCESALVASALETTPDRVSRAGHLACVLRFALGGLLYVPFGPKIPHTASSPPRPYRSLVSVTGWFGQGFSYRVFECCITHTLVCDGNVVPYMYARSLLYRFGFASWSTTLMYPQWPT